MWEKLAFAGNYRGFHILDVARSMLETYPREFNVDRDVLVRCIEACSDCEQACTQCADDCLSEQNVRSSPNASG